MHSDQTVVRGVVKPDGTVEVNAKLNWLPGAVRITIEPLEQVDQLSPSVVEVMKQIRRDQQARGYQGLSPEELEATIAELRDDEEYEARWRNIWDQTQPSVPPKENS